MSLTAEEVSRLVEENDVKFNRHWF
ncbi:hypothetical protein HKBW3S43_01325, partial [Candidatus Hakubella thermalkaliphila]